MQRREGWILSYFTGEVSGNLIGVVASGPLLHVGRKRNRRDVTIGRFSPLAAAFIALTKRFEQFSILELGRQSMEKMIGRHFSPLS